MLQKSPVHETFHVSRVGGTTHAYMLWNFVFMLRNSFDRFKRSTKNVLVNKKGLSFRINKLKILTSPLSTFSLALFSSQLGIWIHKEPSSLFTIENNKDIQFWCRTHVWFTTFGESDMHPLTFFEEIEQHRLIEKSFFYTLVKKNYSTES